MVLRTFCAFFTLVALGQPQAPTRGVDPLRGTLERINARFVELRKQHQERLRACATSQCRLDLNRQFREQSARLSKERTALQGQHRADTRNTGELGSSPPNANNVQWDDWHLKFAQGVSAFYQNRKEALVRDGKWFPNGLKLAVVYTVNRDGTVVIVSTSQDPVPEQFKQVCLDAIKAMNNSAQAIFPQQSNRNCVRKSFTFNTSEVTPHLGIEDIEALPVDPKGWCPDLSAK
jgi:hypothetical protein